VDRPANLARRARARTAFALLCASLFVAASGPAAPHASPQASRAAPALGVEFPLAGDDGGEGLAAWQGAQLAVELWNGDPTHVHVDVVFRDTSRHGHLNPHQDEGMDSVENPEYGAAIVREFAADPRILAVVGALRTNVADEEAPVASELGLPIVSVGASHAPAAGGAPIVFRIASSDDDEGALAGSTAQLRGYRDVAIVGQDDIRAREVARGFERTFSARPNGASADGLLHAGPLSRGTFLAPGAAAGTLLGPEERRRMGRRGYAPPATPFAYDRIMRAPQLDPGQAAGVRARYHERWGLMPTEDALDAYVAAEAALAAIARAGAGGLPASRAKTLAAFRAGLLPTAAGDMSFTSTGGPYRACFSVGSFRNGSEFRHTRACRTAVFP
jgi:ABC-type branched-subunit amino acid transport system substrate-binding protein